MTDSTGTVVWSADYKPFGEATTTVNTITNNLRFPGQYFDAETGLNYNYFRDYNPAIGKYKQADPIGLQKGTNHLYAYVRNNPINKQDALGLSERCHWFGFSATIAVGVGVQIVREGGRCTDDCGRSRNINRICFCACVGLGASASGQWDRGDASSNQEGWNVSTPWVSISGSGSSITGVGRGPGAGLFYCWCSCINS